MGVIWENFGKAWEMRSVVQPEPEQQIRSLSGCGGGQKRNTELLKMASSICDSAPKPPANPNRKPLPRASPPSI